MTGCPTDSKRINSVQIYQAKLAAGGKSKIRLYNVIFLILYLVQTAIVLSTIGEPYRRFLEKADQEGFQGKLLEEKMPLLSPLTRCGHS